MTEESEQFLDPWNNGLNKLEINAIEELFFAKPGRHLRLQEGCTEVVAEVEQMA
jgi:hypothetical protein